MVSTAQTTFLVTLGELAGELADDAEEMRDAERMATKDPFDTLAGELNTPMVVVTAASVDGERAGCLVGFSTQVSINPKRFMVAISKTNHTFGVAQDALVLVVHILRPGDTEIARRFGELTGDETDKFEGLVIRDGPGMIPVIDGLDWFAGRVLTNFDLGDHVGFVLAPNDGVALRVGAGHLTLSDTESFEPGHEA